MESSRAQRRRGLEGLHVLVDDDPRWSIDPVEQARRVCAASPPVVQLRVKHASDRAALAWAREIRNLTRACGATFIVNDRFDLALASAADGVHLGWDDLPPASLPPGVRDKLLIGRSTHTLAQIEVAMRESVDYIALGPIFGTTSKVSEYDERGLALLEAAAKTLACADAAPQCLVAIGGITRDNCDAVLGAGAKAVAVISAVLEADDLAAATAELLAYVERHAPRCERGMP